MSDEKDHHYCKSFIAKGRILRNKCAQVKVQERYLNKQPHLFLQGKSTVPPPLDSTLIIPSCELFLQFQSILNFLPLSSSSNKTLLILQTVLRSALAKGDQKFQKTCKTLLYDTPSAARVLFLNETISDTCSDQQEKEPKDSYEIRLFIKACLHLQHTIGCSVVVLTCDQSDPLYEKSSLSGLCVETIIAHLENERQFSRMTSAALTNIIVSADEILAHYRRSKCTSSTLEDDHEPGSDDVLRMKKSTYSGHLSVAEVAIGIKNGTLLSGKVVIFPHNFLEAEVATAGGVTALISGRSDLNRAMDGDEVVIRLHPKDKWKRILGSLSLIVQTDNSDPPDDMLNLEQLENEEKEVIKDDGGGAVMPAGMVVAIIKREVSEMVVTVPFNNFTDSSAKADSVNSFGSLEKESFIIVNPLDMRLPKIRLRTRQWSKLQGYRIVVAFDNWPQDSIFPNGHLVRVIGESNDSKTEVESILIRHSIFPRPFSASALACVPVVDEPPPGTETPVVDKPDTGHRVWRDSGWCMPTDQLSDLNCNDEYSFRRDYRDCRRVFSVDPPGCQDIDDAMSITWVEGKQGVIEVAVSIADVCAFLPQECALDLEAQARGTTVYLTHMRLNMLPSLISGDIASLHGGKDRFALTVVWHIAVTHADGKPVSKSEDPLLLHDNKDIIFATPLLHSCGRTAIRSVAAMTYAQAQNLILGHDPDPVPSTVPPGQAGRTVAKPLWEGLRSDLRMLTVFGRYLKGQREKNGALDLTQTGGELKFKLDSEGDPMDVKCKEEMEVHNTIAELMIICNSTVAYIVESYKPLEALVRVHAPPPPDQQKEILRLVVETGQGIFDSGADVKLRNQLRSFRENMLFPKKKHAKADDKKTAESIVDFVTSSVIKSMCEALYVNAGSLSGGIFSCEGASVTQGETRLSGHYGLGLNYYTHFTSPIRRYADIMVHRQLLGILESLGCGSGLKQIQLPAKEGVVNPNVCIDYSDRSNIQKDTQSSSAGGILPEGISTDSTGPRALIPQSIVPELRTLVSPHDNTNQPVPQAPYVAPDFDPHFTENVTATSEDDLLNDLLSSSASTALPWDDSFLDSLLEGKTDDDDLEIRAKQLESCADNSLDFLLDHPASSSSTSSAPALPSTSTRAAKNASKSISAVLHDTPDTRIMRQKGTASPYTSDQVDRITAHLNIMNRRSKAVQMECQKMFLRVYFLTRVEEHDAIVYSLRDNGFLAYIPVFDYKGPVYLQNKEGNVCMDPFILSGERSRLSDEIGAGENPAHKYDAREKVMPEYECTLRGQIEEGKTQELAISLKGKPDTPAVRLTVLQRVRVAITSIPPKGCKSMSALRMVLVSVSSSGEKIGAVDKKKADDVKYRLTDMVIKGERSNDLKATSSQPAPGPAYKTRKEQREQSLYCAFKDTPTIQQKESKIESQKKVLKQSIASKRYELMPGRVAYGTVEDIRPIFKLNRSKEVENEKAREKNSANGVSSQSTSSSNKKVTASAHSMVSINAKDDFLVESLKDGKAAAMMKMQLLGEEWAEEEDLPTTWEAGLGGGADTETGVKALTGGFSKEASLASARQNKLKIAKKNSKYG